MHTGCKSHYLRLVCLWSYCQQGHHFNKSSHGPDCHSLISWQTRFWVLIWHIWDEGAEKETNSISFFCSWKTYPWWLHSVISLVAMRGHASPCPTKISNKALSHHNWVLCTLYHTRYLNVVICYVPFTIPGTLCCIMLCTLFLYHTQHHNWVSPYLLYHTVHCLAMYLVHCTKPWSQKPQVHIAFNVSGKRWYMNSGTKCYISIFSLPHDWLAFWHCVGNGSIPNRATIKSFTLVVIFAFSLLTSFSC